MEEALIEKVARALCGATGENPDTEIATGRMKGIRTASFMGQEPETFPRWHQFKDEARRHIAVWNVLGGGGTSDGGG